MKEMIPTEQLVGMFSRFKCTRDKDIQVFINDKAMSYESRGWCSIYVLVNEDELEKNRNLFADGFFTLSNKVIKLSHSISNAKKKKLFSGVNKEEDFLHFVLIGQLGKHIDESNDEPVYGNTSAKEMLDKAFEIVYQVKERITCNCVLVECKDDPKVCKIYEDYGFQELQKDGLLVQYIKFI